jgi:hypothetical protein
MQIRGALSRRSSITLCVVSLVALAAVSSAAAGSVLPDGARFHESLGGSSGITVAVDNGVSVTLAGVPIKCDGNASRSGAEARVGIGLSSSIQPKVGKTINISKTRKSSGGRGESSKSSTTEVTLKFKTAQQVVVAIHQTQGTTGKFACEGSATFKVARQG